MDLVHDDGLDVGEDLARARREKEIQRLGGGDEDVGGVRIVRARSAAGVSPRCARRTMGTRNRRRPAVSRRRRCRRGALVGSARCPPPAPSAARRRAPGSECSSEARAQTPACRAPRVERRQRLARDPVGARRSTDFPATTGPNASDCARVGSPSVLWNHSRTAGRNAARGSFGTAYSRRSPCFTPRPPTHSPAVTALFPSS